MNEHNTQSCIENCESIASQLEALTAKWNSEKATIPPHAFKRCKKAYESVYHYQELNLYFYTFVLQNDIVNANKVKIEMMNVGRSLMVEMEQNKISEGVYVDNCDALKEDVVSVDTWIK